MCLGRYANMSSLVKWKHVDGYEKKKRRSWRWEEKNGRGFMVEMEWEKLSV
jgi:hypothetical protein